MRMPRGRLAKSQAAPTGLSSMFATTMAYGVVLFVFPGLRRLRFFVCFICGIRSVRSFHEPCAPNALGGHCRIAYILGRPAHIYL